MYYKSGIVTDTGEVPIPIDGALVSVIDSAGGLATLLDAAGDALDNPIVSDRFGAYSYYVSSEGLYTHQYRFGGRLRSVEQVVVGTLIAAVSPSPENAGKFIAYDASGNPTASYGTGADLGLRTDLAEDGGPLIKVHGELLEDVLDALAGSNVTTEATTARTLTAADIGKIISCTADTAVTITVPAGLGASFYCSIAQIGAGQVTVSAGSGASLANADAQYATQARYVRLTLWASSADNLVLEGRTA